MADRRNSVPPSRVSRRRFLERSLLGAIGGAALSRTLAAHAHAAGTDLLRVGLIGCGGRGTGAAAQALQADKNVKLVAMADAFADRVEKSLAALQAQQAVAGKLDVPPERRFAGFDAYQKLIASGVDVVLLCEPPHFRPVHLKAAVEAGLHVFAEKPVAVDAPGVRLVLQTCQEAEKKRLSIVSGLCLRYCSGFQETAKRVHDGQIGEVLALEANDYRSGGGGGKPREPGMTDMHWQMRNWYFFTWLSGDFNVEQHVHSLDKAAWAMHDEPPLRATGLGGRQVRVDEQWGNVYDHFAVVYEYANGAKLFSQCRQMAGCSVDVSDHLVGSKGSAEMMHAVIEGPQAWRYRGAKPNMYEEEHRALFAGIRSANPLNNGVYMARSSMLAIMGRMASYTGQTLTWEQCLNSTEDLTPSKYEWVEVPLPQVAKPGLTRFS